MQVIIKDFTDESTAMVYPCLLQHKPDHLEQNAFNDIILAISSNADFITAIVLTTHNQLSGFSVGQTVERYILKKHYQPYHGEVILKN